MENQKEIQNKGGTMRLGAYNCKLEKTVLLIKHKQDSIIERHRHRYEFNNSFQNDFTNME